MTSFKTVSKTAAALSLSLFAATLTHAQDSSPALGSTDIWSTNFQKVFATDSADHRAQGAPIHAGSTDIWSTNFQAVFAAGRSIHGVSAMEVCKASTDIYTTNFQKAYL